MSLSGIFTYAGSGDDLYQSFTTSLNWQPNKIFSIQVSLPYVMNSGENKATFMNYEASGIGDVRITAWADFTQLLDSIKSDEQDKNDVKEDEEIPEEFLEDPFAEVTGVEKTASNEKDKKAKPDNRPYFKFGLGIKIPTGDSDVEDSLGVLLPARYQPGWGVSSLILGAGYRQTFGKLRSVATLTYDLSGGKNNSDYERGDIVRFDTAIYYPLYSKYMLIGGFGYSLTWIPQEDKLAGVEVNNTNGTFHSVVLTGLIKVYKKMNASLMIKIPIGATSSETANDLDFQYSFGITYSF